MKKILLMAALMACVGAMAQGTLNFRTTTAMPVFNADGVTKLTGNSFYAQLYVNVGGSYTPVGAPAAFLNNGTLNGGVVTIAANALTGRNVTLQLRAWEATTAGTAGTYEAALGAGKKAGMSSDFVMATADPLADPPGTPPNIAGLGSFSLIPEPSTIALGLIGAAALLLRRRK